MSCDCPMTQPGPTLAGTCGGGAFMLFMGLLEVFLKSQCDLEDPCGRPEYRREMDGRYDFIVIGGGSAGSVVAARLSEVPQWKVLLIEAGMDEPTGTQVPSMFLNFLGSSIDWAYHTEPESGACLGEKERRCFWPRGKVLGGTSVINGMMYMRGSKKDYDDWAAAGCTGWSYDEVMPYFLKSEDNKQPHQMDRGYHSVGGPLTVSQFPYHPPLSYALLKAGEELGYQTRDVNGEYHTGFTIAQTTNRNGSRLSTARAFLRPARSRPNLHIMLNTTATKVLINQTTKMAYGVELIDSFGEKKIVYANNEVILSGGAVNSPQVLLLSGIGASEELNKVGIEPIHELPAVGRNLHNHVAFSLNFHINDTNTTPLNWATAMEYLLFRDGLMSGTGISEVTAFVNSKYADTTIDHPDLQFFFGGFLANCAKTGQVGEKIDNGTRTIQFYPAVLRPKSRGYLTLASKDPLKHPKIYAGYLTHPDDIKILVEGIKFGLKIAETKSLKKFGIRLDTTPIPGCENIKFGCDAYWECAARTATGPENHQVGSCKMGAPGDPTVVVNNLLQVQGIDRLRVADASVIPSITSGNTMAPAVMIAEKVSDMIKMRWLEPQAGQYPLDATKNFLNGVFHNNEFQPHSASLVRQWRSWK